MCFVPFIFVISCRLTCASQEPLLDPDYVEAGCYAPSAAAASVRRSSTTKSSGFKFTLPVRSSSRTVLSKRREDQPRRNTVTSIIASKESQTNSVWPHVDARPRSSQSTLPGELTVPDEPSNESIFSRESAALGAPSPSQGGLFPRPASLQRHWSDVGSAAQQQQQQQQQQKKPDVSTPDPKPPLLAPERLSQLRSNDPDRIRPLSFGGLSNGFGTLRITEAAALESRVKELETHVADLRSIIADTANWPPSRHHHQQQHQQPFDGSALSSGAFNRSPSQSFSRLDSDTTVAPEDSLLYDQLSPRGSLGRDRERALSVLEGLHLDPDNKRNTLSTIRGPRRGSMRSVSENSPQSHLPPPSMPEYSGIVAMVKREQKARRRLEQQVAALQEQMAAVLHRQLVDQTSRSQSVLDNPSSPSRRTHDFSISPVLRKASSSEIPTPDVTPPSSSAAAAAARQSANLNMFMSFDGSGRAAASDGDDGDDHHHLRHHHHHNHDDRDFYKPASESDAWKTPAEERGNPMERTDSTSTFGDALMAFPPPAGAGRTLSLSQLTQSSSLVPQRV